MHPGFDSSDGRGCSFENSEFVGADYRRLTGKSDNPIRSKGLEQDGEMKIDNGI